MGNGKTVTHIGKTGMNSGKTGIYFTVYHVCRGKWENGNLIYPHCIVLYINEHHIIIKMEVFLVLLSKLIAPQLE